MIAKKRIMSVMLAGLFFAFNFFPVISVCAGDALTSEPAFTDEIFLSLKNRTEQFTLNTAVNLKETEVNKAFGDAASRSMTVLHSVKSYGYSIDDKSVTFTVEYSENNGYDYTFSPDYNEIGIIVSRVISQRKPGINIYVEDRLYFNDIDYVLAKADEIYNRYKAETGDQYSAYLVSEIMYSVVNVSFKKGGFFLTYAFKYNETPEQTVNVDKKASEVASNISDTKDTVEKIRYVNDWIKKNTTYKDTGKTSDYTAYGLIRNQTAVCQGYSLAAYKMLTEAGVQCGIVTGKAKDPYTGREGLHMWNIVNVDGEWYHLDITWNDAFKSSDPYFLLTDEQIKADHSFDTKIFNPIAYEEALNDMWLKEESTIKLKIGSPYMLIGDYSTEIDYGRGTVPIIKNDRTLLPIRTVIEALGGEVVWDAKSSHIIINYHNYVLDLWLNNNVALVNGMEVLMDVPIIISNGRSMVPLRFVAEMLGMGVEWNADTKEITVVPF